MLAGLLLAGCSAERNNPLSKAYHNTTARYNGYFLAKEKLNAIEKSIQDQTVYDYNRILPIFPPLDSTTYKAHAADLEDVVKKASFPIQYHQNSKWVDDSYLLIGKVRFYELNFPDAAKTFKYVNSVGKDRHVQHEALVWLMRSFMQMGEMDNAQQVSEFLRKERLNKDNARELYLARAQFHLLQNDTTGMVENLALSLPNFEKKDDQSRVRFSLARLYQEQGQNQEAYKQYTRLLRRNPPYDLGFFSRLYLGQVSELSDAQDLDRIAGYYQKMLKDEKNTEYRDKIYYEMAVFERRQQNYDKALEYLNESIKNQGSLPNQKAYTYLEAGRIYFENLNKYDLAQAYYDSAVQVYPQQAPEYEALAERRDVLADFAKQHLTIQTEDSLQRLAQMSEAERLAFVESLVQREEELRQQELARQQEQQKTSRREERQQNTTTLANRNNTAIPENGSNTGIFYFDNPAAMATARSEFVRRWGDRPLQDNWRLRSRGETTGQEEAVALEQPAEAAAETEETIQARLQSQVQTYLQNIPSTTLAIQQSEKMVEDAMFRLANIYAQKLNDPEKAIAQYEQLLQRFLHTEYAPEAYYSLYLIYGRTGDERKNVYYDKIKQQFPGTTYAMLVDDPTFLSKNALENVKAHTLYDSAFTVYEQGEYAQAATLLTDLNSQYPRHDIQDKVAFLRVMITARTEKPALLREQLLAFKAKYPASPLLPRAEQLLANYTTLEEKQLLRKEAPQPATASTSKTNDTRTPEQKVSTRVALATARGTNQVKRPATAETDTPPVAQVPDTTLATANSQPATRPGVPDTTTASPALPADTLTAAVPPADPLAYTSESDTAYYFVLVYPEGHASFKEVEARYSKYNNTYFKNLGLQMETQPYEAGQVMLLARPFPDLKSAQSFNIKQKGPQSPIGKIRGVEFTTFVISSANFQKLLQKKDLEAYLNYFRTNN